MFFLRCTNTLGMEELLSSFDIITREALSSIVGHPITDLQWRQANLPLSMGGLGLQAALDMAPIAFSTSSLSSQSLINDLLHPGADDGPDATLPAPLLQHLSDKMEEEVTVETLTGVTQKMATFKLNQLHHRLLLDDLANDGGQREQARMRCLGNKRSGDWLTVVPSASLGLLLRGQEFTMALKYRLGIPVYSREAPCPACDRPSDTMGDHALGCGSLGERIARHNLLRDALHQTASSAALAPVKEGRFLLPGRDARPADLLIPRWEGGKDTCLDVTVISPLQQAMVQGAAATDGFALNKAFERKVARAGEPCRQAGLAFIPLAADTLGGWHSVATKQVTKLATAQARHTGEAEDVTVRLLRQRLSLLLMKGNSALLIGRVPEPEDPDGLFG